MIIRRYEKEDLLQVLKLFKETIQSINRRDYTEEQIKSWADSSAATDKWEIRLEESLTYVACANGKITGFGSLDKKGKLIYFILTGIFKTRGSDLPC